MTIEQLSSLYAKGLYSPINYYYDLLAMLRSGADFDRAMSCVPPPFLGQIKEFAARSWQSPQPDVSPEERLLERRILLWGEPPEKQRLLDPAPPEPKFSASARAAMPPSPENLELAQKARRGSAVLKLVSSPIRLRIVLWLVEDEKGKALSRALKRSPATYTHHLALLRQSGVVSSKRGRTTTYRLSRRGKELADVALSVLAFEEKPAKAR